MKAKTMGVSPKAVWAVVAAIGAYLLTQELVELPALVELLLNAVLVGGAVAAASPGSIKFVGRTSRLSDESGYGVVEGAIALLIVVVAIVVLLRVV